VLSGEMTREISRTLREKELKKWKQREISHYAQNDRQNYGQQGERAGETTCRFACSLPCPSQERCHSERNAVK